MASASANKIHDFRNALRVLTMLSDLVAQGYDFSSEEGRDILEEAQKAKVYLEKESSEISFEKNRTSKDCSVKDVCVSVDEKIHAR
jgi:hypothetical protein